MNATYGFSDLAIASDEPPRSRIAVLLISGGSAIVAMTEPQALIEGILPVAGMLRRDWACLHGGQYTSEDDGCPRLNLSTGNRPGLGFRCLRSSTQPDISQIRLVLTPA